LKNSVRERRLGEVTPFGVLDGIFMAGNARVAASLAGQVIALVNTHRELILAVEEVIRSGNRDFIIAAGIVADSAKVAAVDRAAAEKQFEGEGNAVAVHQGPVATFEDFGLAAGLCPLTVDEVVVGAVVADGFADGGSAAPICILIDLVRETRAEEIYIVCLRRDALEYAHGVEMLSFLEEQSVVGAAQFAARRIPPESDEQAGEQRETEREEAFGRRHRFVKLPAMIARDCLGENPRLLKIRDLAWKSLRIPYETLIPS
jgi:hypothetical protein